MTSPPPHLLPPRLLTERALTRLAAPEEAHKLLDFFRDAGKRYDPPLPDALLSLEHWRSHSQQLLAEHATGTAVRMFVFSRDEEQILGSVGLTRITRGVRFDCSLSYGLRQSQEGTGLMSEVVGAVIRYAFAGLGLHRIDATHALDNERSRRLLERAGFEPVGIIRGSLLSGGRWHDAVLQSLLNPDWHPR